MIAANPAALATIRDDAANSMARVAAIRELEALDAADVVHTRTQGQTPGIIIVISPRENTALEPAPAAVIEHAPRADAEPVFDPDRPVS